VFMVALAGTFGMYQMMLSQLRIGGPVYDTIQQSNNLIADILPPDEFIIESYLVALELSNADTPLEIKQYIERFRKLQLAYETRHAYWIDQLSAGPLKQKLVEDSYKPAMQFYQLVNREVIPPVEAGANLESVRKILDTTVRAAFLQHTAQIQQTVALAKQRIQEVESTADTMRERWHTVVIVFGLTAVVLLGTLSLILVRSIVIPLNQLIERVRDMAEGSADLTKRVEVRSSDEIGRLSALINAMILRIHDVFVRTRASSIHLNSTSVEIASSAASQCTTVQTFNASGTEIAAAVKQMSTTGHELAKTMVLVDSRAGEAAEFASAGRSALQGMQESMQTLGEATSAFSAKLEVIREKASGINVVVTTITKVAEQTNLLSINAAIEAEKSGEAGRGFLVVAREIRRLADQTASASMDIELMVRQMQSAVTSGVMEMDKFNGQVSRCTQLVGSINGQMGQVIEQVGVLKERFSHVTDSVQQQSEGVGQINAAMGTLIAGFRQVGHVANEFEQASSRLRASATELQLDVGKFVLQD